MILLMMMVMMLMLMMKMLAMMMFMMLMIIVVSGSIIIRLLITTSGTEAKPSALRFEDIFLLIYISFFIDIHVLILYLLYIISNIT